MAGLLSAAELAACRAQQAASFDLTATQQRETSDGWGLIADAETTIATLPCRLAPQNNPLLQALANVGTANGGQMGQVGNVTSWMFTCPEDADVRVGDRITIGTDTYRVNSVQAPTSYSTATRALVSEVR